MSKPRSAITHLLPVSLEGADWSELRGCAPEPAVASLRAILQALEGTEERIFAIRGMAALLIEERELYRFVTDEEVGDYYQSMDRFLKQEFPKSWGDIRAALRTVKALKETPFADLVAIRRCNLEQLVKVSSNVRALPAVVEAAKVLPEKALVEELNRKHGQHLDVRQPIAMAPVEDCDEFETAISIAMVVEHCASRAEAIKAVAVSYIQEHAVEAEHVEGAA